ncbi:MAG: MOSC domain-containing protein [Mesorhizobium amorphae]|nr:MAG: MOSC domain-containing protein [Mesorhizobium amorphae]
MKVASVAASPGHSFSKAVRGEIRLLEGLGVEGDAHAGVTVKHRSRVAKDPTQPNLRQVHLVQGETLAELSAQGFRVEPGTIGENVLTEGIDLLALPTGAVLHLGEQARVEVTGLRNPCAQLDNYQAGLTRAVLDRDAEGNLVRKAGVMAVVLSGGTVAAGDPITVTLPPEPHRPLEKV